MKERKADAAVFVVILALSLWLIVVITFRAVAP